MVSQFVFLSYNHNALNNYSKLEVLTKMKDHDGNFFLLILQFCPVHPSLQTHS